MARRHFQLVFLGAVGFAMLVYYQNCAPQGGRDSLILDSSRVVGTPQPVNIREDFTFVTRTGVADQGTVACPSGFTVSGCSNACAGAAAGGAYIDQNVCRGRCNVTTQTMSLTAFCTKTRAGRVVTTVENRNATRLQVANCPSGTKLLGCSSMCANAFNSGASIVTGNAGCQLQCDADGPGGILIAYCLNDAGDPVTLDYVRSSAVASGSTLTCPTNAIVVGATHNCQNTRAGAETISFTQVTGTCQGGEPIDITAVCAK